MGNMNNKSSTISKWCYIKRTRHRLSWAFQPFQDAPFSCRIGGLEQFIQVLLSAICTEKRMHHSWEHFVVVYSHHMSQPSAHSHHHHRRHNECLLLQLDVSISIILHHERKYWICYVFFLHNIRQHRWMLAAFKLFIQSMQRRASAGDYVRYILSHIVEMWGFYDIESCYECCCN